MRENSDELIAEHTIKTTKDTAGELLSQLWVRFKKTGVRISFRMDRGNWPDGIVRKDLGEYAIKAIGSGNYVHYSYTLKPGLRKKRDRVPYVFEGLTLLLTFPDCLQSELVTFEY